MWHAMGNQLDRAAIGFIKTSAGKLGIAMIVECLVDTGDVLNIRSERSNVVRNNNDGNVPVQFHQHVSQLKARISIKRGAGFIEKKNFGIGYQCPSYHYPL